MLRDHWCERGQTTRLGSSSESCERAKLRSTSNLSRILPVCVPASVVSLRNVPFLTWSRETISHYMHNYGYPNYYGGIELYPPMINPWAPNDDQEDPFTDLTVSQERSDEKARASQWNEDPSDIRKPQPVHLSPPKPSYDMECEQRAAEKLVSGRFPSPRQDRKGERAATGQYLE